MQPQTDKLQIVDLKADYAVTLRLRGKPMNRSAVYAHAPSLEVTILSASGDPLGSHVIQPDDSVIRPAMASEFFTQLVLGEGSEPTVTVTAPTGSPAALLIRDVQLKSGTIFGKKLGHRVCAAEHGHHHPAPSPPAGGRYSLTP